MIHHVAGAATVDKFGDPQRSFTDVTLTGVPVWPVEGNAVSDRSVVPVRLSMIVEVAVAVDDEFTVRGVRARQYRSPMHWVNPHLASGDRGYQVYVERIVGA